LLKNKKIAKQKTKQANKKKKDERSTACIMLTFVLPTKKLWTFFEYLGIYCELEKKLPNFFVIAGISSKSK